MKVEEKRHMYSCSIDLMEAVRKRDYKNQYKICYAFYDEIIKYPQWNENEFCLFFDELYERIDSDLLDDEITKIRQCVNEMDIALRRWTSMTRRHSMNWRVNWRSLLKYRRVYQYNINEMK